MRRRGAQAFARGVRKETVAIRFRFHRPSAPVRVFPAGLLHGCLLPGLLALGLAAQEPRAPLRLAFLGLPEAAYPEYGPSFNGWVESELAGDSAWSTVPGSALRRHIADSLGGVARWDFDALRPAALRRNLDYLADVEPLPVSVATDRTWWMPWTLRYREAWSLRLRLYDARARRLVREDTVWAVDSGKVFRLTPYRRADPPDALGQESLRRPWFRRFSLETARMLTAAADSLKKSGP